MKSHPSKYDRDSKSFNLEGAWFALGNLLLSVARFPSSLVSVMARMYRSDQDLIYDQSSGGFYETLGRASQGCSRICCYSDPGSYSN